MPHVIVPLGPLYTYNLIHRFTTLNLDTVLLHIHTAPKKCTPYIRKLLTPKGLRLYRSLLRGCMGQQMCAGPRNPHSQFRREIGVPGRGKAGCYEHPFRCGLFVSSQSLVFLCFTSVSFPFIYIWLFDHPPKREVSIPKVGKQCKADPLEHSQLQNGQLSGSLRIGLQFIYYHQQRHSLEVSS